HGKCTPGNNIAVSDQYLEINTKMRISLRAAAFAVAALCLVIARANAAETRPPTQDGILYGTADGQPLTMDYYAPKGSGDHPIVIIIHGGGYHGGDSKNGSEAY